MNIIKKNLPRYFLLTFVNLISAISFNLLVKPINLVSGGSPGLSLVISKITNLTTSQIVIIIYIITFILGVIFLDKKSVIGIIYASIIYPLFVNMTDGITNSVILSYNDTFLIVIIASIISGISSGIIYKNGFASSGIGIIAPLLNKYFKVAISEANFVINTMILLLGGYFFGFNIVLYALCYLYISNYICNMIILGVSQNKVILIKSKKIYDVIHCLKEKYNINAIIMESDNPTAMILTNNRYYSLIRNDLVNIDKEIFFTTDNCYEVME